MPEILSTAVICAVIAAAVFFSARKLWRDKKSGKTCCGGSCGCCQGCGKKRDETGKTEEKL